MKISPAEEQIKILSYSLIIEFNELFPGVTVKIF